MNISNKIKFLDKITANQIAAGEVIEAPSSVVKELVENSIDAGSNQISIKVEKAGIDYIKVHDNGIGMGKEDLVMAFQRHATSKISTSGDLFSLKTLGFRGEALPSISSVAKVKVTSKTGDNILGWQFSITDGEENALIETGCNTGTTILVEDLFYNTPARKKYLKSPLSEMANITDIVSKLALANPKISFNLISNGRQVLKTPGTNNLIDVVTCLWGTEMKNNLTLISGTANNVTATGYIGNISYHRPNRKGQLFFVNDRFVKSKVIAQGLEEGYRTLLPINRFPFGIIKLQVNPEEIDVNIHPTKLEVKFLNPLDVKNSLKEIVLEAIQSNTTKVINLEKTPKKTETQPPLSNIKNIQPHYVEKISTDSIREEQVALTTFNAQVAQIPAPTKAEVLQQIKSSDPEESTSSQIASLRALGQINSTYIACEGKDGLYLIDQHAAHERVIYEKLINTRETKFSSQQLLFPVNVELSPSEAEVVIENILILHELGFILEHFGGSTFVIREVPEDLPKGEEASCFYELLELFQENKTINIPFREKAIILLSCRTAIKAGESLTKEEIHHLLAELAKVTSFQTCPHGRPTIISFSHDLLANKFLRK